MQTSLEKCVRHGIQIRIAKLKIGRSVSSTYLLASQYNPMSKFKRAQNTSNQIKLTENYNLYTLCAKGKKSFS